jgi:hypothetical protein
VRQIFPFSSIRTLTVGFGIAPNLLTPPIARQALAGFGDRWPFTAGGDFHPAPRTRSDRNPTNAINAPLAKPCNDFRELLDHAEPTERFPRPMTIIRPHVIHIGAALGCEQSLDAR